MSTSRYLGLHAALTLLAALLAWGFTVLGPEHRPALGAMLLGIGLCSAVKLGAYLLQRPGMQAADRQFVNRVMAGMMLKMLLSLLLMLLVYALAPAQLVPYTLAYFFLYFILSGFEVYALQSNLRSDSPSEHRPH